MFSVASLALGGIAVGIVSGVDAPERPATSSFLQTLFSGLLVGIGTKVFIAFFYGMSDLLASS